MVESRLSIYHGYSCIIGTINDVLYNIVNEFDRRFSRDNIACWKSKNVLIPNTERFLKPIVLKPLYEYAMTIPTIKRKLRRDADTDNLNVNARYSKTC